MFFRKNRREFLRGVIAGFWIVLAIAGSICGWIWTIYMIYERTGSVTSLVFGLVSLLFVGVIVALLVGRGAALGNGKGF